MTYEILIADDDAVILDLLTEYLESENCHVTRAYNGLEALDNLNDPGIDLVVLDIMMPQLDGIETLKRIRKFSTVPVIMLTARGDDLDRIIGLELGADDYIPKPCNPRELLARIKAVIRRSRAQFDSNPAGNLSYRAGGLEIDGEKQRVHHMGKEVTLTHTEFELLSMMVAAAERVVSREEISRTILGRELGRWDRSVDVHISNLRKKLGDDDAESSLFRTVRGVGYQFMAGTRDR